MKLLAVLRAERFSPNSVEKDRAIMMAVVNRLGTKGWQTEVVGEESLGAWKTEGSAPDVVLSMGRLPETLRWQRGLGSATTVVNRPEGVERCARSVLAALMSEAGTPVPPSRGDRGYWLKRGDAAAQERGDVRFARDEEELKNEIDEFRRRGIADYVVSAHVEGDLVKFYGVRGTGFFRYFYPTDDGDTKFGDEARNGRARHYRFSTIDLQRASERLAAVVGIDVYGGDCIVREDGSYCIIDFNDWPSFSRCREEAAEAIAGLVESI